MGKEQKIVERPSSDTIEPVIEITETKSSERTTPDYIQDLLNEGYDQYRALKWNSSHKEVKDFYTMVENIRLSNTPFRVVREPEDLSCALFVKRHGD